MKFFKFSFLLAVIFAFSSAAASAQETGGVKGKVRTAQGAAVAGVTVTARQQSKDVKSVIAGEDGKFILSGLQPGVYNIVFDKNGYTTGIKYNVEVKKSSTKDLGDRLIMVVDQGTQVILKGSVFNQDGRSVTGARVEIEKIGSDGSTKKLRSAYTNISGEFTFRFSEGAAKYRVTASAKDASASKDIEVSSAAIYRLAISLKLDKE